MKGGQRAGTPKDNALPFPSTNVMVRSFTVPEVEHGCSFCAARGHAELLLDFIVLERLPAHEGWRNARRTVQRAFQQWQGMSCFCFFPVLDL